MLARLWPIGSSGGITCAEHPTPSRRGYRRSRVCRTLHAVPAAWPRLLHLRIRGREGDWRHLVLEPLSRRALRRREHGLFLLVFGGAPAGVALDRALRVA